MKNFLIGAVFSLAIFGAGYSLTILASQALANCEAKGFSSRECAGF